MSAIEKELTEATGFVPRKNYPDRQDYLAAIARAVDGLEDVDFEGLSTEAAEWFNAAARALSAKKVIVDFADRLDVGEEVDDDEPEEVVEQTPVKIKSSKVPPKPVDPIKTRKKETAAMKQQLPKEELEYDKFGCIVGSKNGKATLMFEQSSKMTEVTKALGGTYYNLIAKLIKRGHKVEKGPHGEIKLTYVKPKVKE